MDRAVAAHEPAAGVRRRGLGGGTGSGMFLDVAYAVRNRLRRMGYEHAGGDRHAGDSAGRPVREPPQALGNTYAALTELNHYSRPDTIFAANYDERFGLIQEKSPPFARCYIIPGQAAPRPAAVPVGAAAANGSHRSSTPPTILQPGSRVIAKPGSRVMAKPGSRIMPALGRSGQSAPAAAPRPALKCCSDAAELIRLNLFELLGRAVDETRAASESPAPKPGTLTAFGLTGYSWPSAEVVARTAAKVARSVLKQWATPNAKRTREVIPSLAQAHWAKLGLDPATVQAQLQFAADRAAGGRSRRRSTSSLSRFCRRGG